MYFYLKEPNSDKVTPIYLIRYCKNDGRNFKYSTGQKIDPVNWDFDNRMPKAKRGGEGIKNRSITVELQKYANLMDENTNLGVSGLKRVFDDKFRGKKQEKKELVELLDYFIDMKKKSGGVSYRWVERYVNIKKRLGVYQMYTQRTIRLGDINQDWLDAYIGFNRYLPDPFPKSIKDKFDTFNYDDWGYNDNTMHRHVNFIFTFLNWADGKYFTKPKINNPVNKFQSDNIYLTQSEINDIISLEGLSPALERSRDLFLIGVYSGQRFSDFSVFEKADIVDGFIVKKSQKVRKVSYIPITPPLEKLLEKYDYELPSISSQKMNGNIKKLCQKAGINSTFKEVVYTGKDKKVNYYEKWKKAGTHTARRTFITLSHEKGISLKTISEVTGLNINTLTNTYLKTSKETIRREMFDKWG